MGGATIWKRKILDENPHWQERFDDFHLSLDDLETGNFPEPGK